MPDTSISNDGTGTAGTELDTTKAVMAPMFRLVSDAPYHIAPERKADLSATIFSDGDWTLRESTVEEAWFSAIPSDKAIYISPSGLASLWSLAFAATTLLDAAASARRKRQPKGATSFAVEIQLDDATLDQYLAFSKVLFKTDKAWPENLVRPKGDEPPDSTIGRVNKVFLGATSWIVLHEIGHVHHAHEKLIPATARAQDEFHADRFATSWILERAGHGLTREFRVLMISVGLIWLFLNEITLGRGHEHPPAILRFREAVQHFKLKGRSIGLELIFYLFKAILVPDLTAPAFATPEEAFDWVCGRIEEKYAV